MSARIEIGSGKKKKKKKGLKAIKKEKEPSSEKSKKSKKDPVFLDFGDLAYCMRHDTKKGIVWHSFIDPDRPNSPFVEWPEIPDYKERPWILDNPRSENPLPDPDVENFFSNPCDTCKPTGQYIYPGENPDKEEDDYDNTAQMPTVPGMYGGNMGVTDDLDDF